MQITLDFQPSAFTALRLDPKAFSAELKTAAVIQWYAKQRISQSKACEILDINRTRFLDELFRRNEKLQQEIETALQQIVE